MREEEENSTLLKLRESYLPHRKSESQNFDFLSFFQFSDFEYRFFRETKSLGFFTSQEAKFGNRNFTINMTSFQSTACVCGGG